MPDIVGLTIQQRSVRGVEAKIGRGGRCTVLRTGEIEIDAGMFDNGRLVDREAFSRCLGELWEQGGFRSTRVRLVIDGRLAVIRRTELPSSSPEQLRKAASYDIAELLSYPVAEAVFDVDEIGCFERKGTTWANALVVAVEQSTLTELRTAVTGAGLRFLGADLAAESLIRGVDAAENAAEEDRPVTVLDCEDTTTNIVIRDRSGVLFARTLGVGVGESTISVADELETALAQLSGEDAESSSLGSAIAGVSTVVESVRRTLSYYTAELDDRPIASVIVAGARGQAPGLFAALEQTLGVPARPARSVASWPQDIEIHGFETPVGAALGAADSKTRHLVLTSDRERAARSRRNNQLAALATALPVLVFLVVSGLNVRADVTAATQTADNAEATTQALSLRLAELETTSQQVAAWEGTGRQIASIEEQRLRLDLVVRQLAETMDADTRLLSIDLERGAASELPPNYSGPPPAGVVTITGVADDLDGVGRWLTTTSGTAVLDGLWLQQSTYGPIGADGRLGALFSARGVITLAARPNGSTMQAELPAAGAISTEEP